MRLPKETLLEIVSCVDYASLVALRFANIRIRRVIEGNEEILAARRTFHLKVSERLILVDEQLEGKCALVTKKKCSLDNYNEAMREVETILRGHPVSNLELHRPLSLSELVDLLPQLAYTKTLFIRRFDSLEGIVDEYIRPLSHLTNLGLGYHYDGFPSTILEILGEDLLLQIPSITFRIGGVPAVDGALEDLLYRFCFDFSGLSRDSKKFVAVHGAYLSNEFCRRIVKVSMRHNRIVRMLSLYFGEGCPQT